MRKYGEWEVDETMFLRSLVKTGWTVYDIGANIGWYTVVLSKEVGPSGAIYSFEPDDDNYELLKKNVAFNDITNTLLYKCAISDADGETMLFKNKQN